MNFWTRLKPNQGRNDEVHQAEMLDVYTRWRKGEKLSRKHKLVLKACQESAELEPLRQLVDFTHYRFQETDSIEPRPGTKERIADAVIRSVSRLSPESNLWGTNDIGLEPVYSPEQVGSESELAYSPTPDVAPILSGADDFPGETIVVEPESSDANHLHALVDGSCNLKLKVIQGDLAGSEYDLVFLQMIMGRETDSTIHLKNNSSASHKHALLSIENEDLYITDLNSRNGTFVDGQRISNQTPIYLASQIRIGNQVLEVSELRRENGVCRITFKEVAGSDVGQIHTVSIEEMTIGRGSIASLRLSDSTRMLSRRHAGFELTAGQLYLSDLGSTNGTYVDGSRIEGPTRINVGSVIKLGGITCIVTAIEHS